jgi:hypothetical protein
MNEMAPPASITGKVGPSLPINACKSIYYEFGAAYQRVRAAVVEDWLDDMIDIVDQPELDPLDKRVRIDARRWISGHRPWALASSPQPGRFAGAMAAGARPARGCR